MPFSQQLSIFINTEVRVKVTNVTHGLCARKQSKGSCRRPHRHPSLFCFQTGREPVGKVAPLCSSGRSCGPGRRWNQRVAGWLHRPFIILHWQAWRPQRSDLATQTSAQKPRPVCVRITACALREQARERDSCLDLWGHEAPVCEGTALERRGSFCLVAFWVSPRATHRWRAGRTLRTVSN